MGKQQQDHCRVCCDSCAEPPAKLGYLPLPARELVDVCVYRLEDEGHG
jgi:hypothetical protein